MNSMKLRKKAFTLVELIIVITILAILATIAFISFQWYIKDARDGNRIATLKSIEKWLDLYFTKVWNYPFPDWLIATGSFNNVPLSLVWNIWENISSIINMNKPPKDPISESNYTYWISENELYYQLATTLENKTAYVIWNFQWLLKDTLNIYKLPGLLFTWDSDFSLNKTYFLENEWINIPYTLDNQPLQNTITWIVLSELLPTKDTWESKKSSLASNFWISENQIWQFIFWNKYFTDFKINNNTWWWTCEDILTQERLNELNSLFLNWDIEVYWWNKTDGFFDWDPQYKPDDYQLWLTKEQWCNDISIIDYDWPMPFTTNLVTSYNALNNLEELYYSKPDLWTQLPYLIQLDNLMLDLKCINDINIYNESVFTLTKLKELSLNNCWIDTLPSSIWNLTQLKNLSMRGNSLTSLPSNIWNLTQLEYLSIGENWLTSLPSEISNLSSLKYLHLQNNPWLWNLNALFRYSWYSGTRTQWWMTISENGINVVITGSFYN